MLKPTHYKILSVLIILILTFLLYSNTLKHNFVNWDDNLNVYANKDIRTLTMSTIKTYFTSFYVGMYQPITTLSLALNYKVSGLNPHPYHFTNLILHLLNVLLIFLFAYRLLRELLPASIVTLIFAIHPMHIESVAWISERKDVLYAFFFLLSLIIYLKYIDNKRNPLYLILSILSFLLSLLCKSAAVVLPMLLFLLDHYRGRKLKGNTFIEKIPFFILSMIFSLLAIYSQQFYVLQTFSTPLNFTIIDRIFMFSYSSIWYIFSFIFPFKFALIHPYPVTATHILPIIYYLSLPALLLIGYSIYYLLKKLDYENRTALILGLGFFIVTILPVVHIIKLPGNSIVAERYTYLAYIGLSLLLVHFGKKFLLSEWIKKLRFLKPLIIAIGILYLLFFSFSTWQHNKVWHDSLTLFTDQIKKYPDLALAYNHRGSALFENKNYKDAYNDYTKAINLNPRFADAYNNRGVLQNELGMYLPAIADFSSAISINPLLADAYFNRANTKSAMNDNNGAIYDFTQAISINKSEPGYFLNRGVSYFMQLKFKEAKIDFLQALNMRQEYPEAWNDLGLADMNLGNFNQAIESFNKTLNLDPNFNRAYHNRGLANYKLNNLSHACNDWNTALRMGYSQSWELISKYCK